MTGTLDRDVMHRLTTTCSPEVHLEEPARIMAQNHIREVVVDGTIGIRGVISDCALIHVYGTNLYERVAGHIPLSHAVTIAPEATLTSAIELMRENNIRSVAVLAGHETTPRRIPNGIVSFTDII